MQDCDAVVPATVTDDVADDDGEEDVVADVGGNGACEFAVLVGAVPPEGPPLLPLLAANMAARCCCSR